MDQTSNNKRIAKNTILLYVRMLLLMLVSLYTSRIVLDSLGVEDYGIYDVVGGVVTMLGFITGSLGAASSRFITYEIGRGDIGSIIKVFNCSLTIFYLLAIGVFLIAETVGLWFVYTQLTIPPERMVAAIWVYQCSILTFILSIISIPYNAIIIAYERMSAFAYISIYEGLAKLAVALLIPLFVADKLIIYAVLILLTQLSIRFVYIWYCKRNFMETKKNRFMWDHILSHKLLSYSGWSLIGSLAVMGSTQGISLLLNVFFGPIVNAARGIAIQVQGAVIQLLSGFTTAMRPQIVKSYASKDLSYMHSLLIRGTKISFFLTLIVVVPIYMNVEYILDLWLTDVPDYTASFVRLLLISSLLAALRVPTLMAVHATGDIKRFQIIEGALLLAVVPVAYIALKWFNISPNGVFIIYLIIEALTQLVRVLIVFPMINLNFFSFIKRILFPVVFSTIPIVFISYALYSFLYSTDLKLFLCNSTISIILSFFIIMVCGFSKSERLYIASMVKTFTKKFVK